jgi:hypothetical protein
MSSVDRGRPLRDLHGQELVRQFLQEIEEEEALGRALGMDLTPPGPINEHAPRVYAHLNTWLRRSEEIHRYREERWRAERSQATCEAGLEPAAEAARPT